MLLHLLGLSLGVVLRAPTRHAGWCSRRGLLAAAALTPLAPQQRAAALPFLSNAAARPEVQVLSEPEFCQGRARMQDFVVVRYTGRFANGTVFDNRYAQRPLVVELGAFYLPGVDEALAERCVGTELLLRWASSPALPDAASAALLPAGSPIELRVQLQTIRYSLFGEKMRDPASDYWFNPAPLTLCSAADGRGHASSSVPTVLTENPFAVSPTSASLISTPTGILEGLFQQFKGGGGS